MRSPHTLPLLGLVLIGAALALVTCEASDAAPVDRHSMHDLATHTLVVGAAVQVCPRGTITQPAMEKAIEFVAIAHQERPRAARDRLFAMSGAWLQRMESNEPGSSGALCSYARDVSNAALGG